MTCSYEIKNYYTVKKSGKYPWPCFTDKDRTISLSVKDVLTKSKDGTFMKHTGMGCFGIILKPNQVKRSKNVAKLILV